ncbi:MAG: flavin reductase [Treponema sp.]|jgi:flavin reductase (DIM6/NTAB) family NADH-FMN oxidoreductase RutF|nr:flavin reductase [Treponema sp.]
MSFKNIDIQDLHLNPIEMIGEEWWLVTAGNKINGYNTMTASWGHIGAIWGRLDEKAHNLPTAIVYVRPHRYTKEFMDREEVFTLSVFDKAYKKALTYLGTHSGRDEDKVTNAGITPVFDDGTSYFAEAKMVFICRKLYHAPLLEQGFVDKSLVENNYPQKDFHEMYIGEIVKILSK